MPSKSRDAPNTGTAFAEYPADPKAGYRISGQIFGLTTIFLLKYKYKTNLKTIIVFANKVKQ
jgi:hypothetical protein